MPLDRRGGAPHVTLLPDAGGERVRVAHEHRAAEPGRAVLVALLAPSDHGEVLIGPARRDAAGLRDGAPHFGHPHRPSRSASARASVVVPVDSAPVMTTRRHRYARTAGVSWSHQAAGSARTAVPEIEPRSRRTCSTPQRCGEQVAVRLPGEDRVDRLVQQRAHDRDVGVVHERVLEVDRDLVPAGHDPRARMPLAHPLPSQRQRDRLAHGPEDEHRDPLATRQRVVDERVVAGVRRQELPEDEAVPHTATRHCRHPCTHSARNTT